MNNEGLHGKLGQPEQYATLQQPTLASWYHSRLRMITTVGSVVSYGSAFDQHGR